MSNGSLSRHDLDTAIDRAVRDLMSHDPRPGLRRRVISVIERGPARVRLFGSAVSAAAVAAMILLAFALWRPDAPSESGSALSQSPSASAFAPSATADRPSQPPNALSQSPSAPSQPPSALSQSLSAPSQSRSASAFAPGATADRPSRSPSVPFGAPTGRVSATSVTDRPLTEAPRDSPAALAPIALAPLRELNEIRIEPIVIPRIWIPALAPLR